MALMAISAANIAPARPDMVWTFASCTGRLSAQMEHQWLLRDAGADQTERRRETMIALLEATMHPDDGPTVLSWRIEAKLAQSQLLTRATFNTDTADASWARNRAEAEIAACNGLLLS
ncbi:MAG: hypothetical protein AAFY06_05820 [Pseudomonadota bacterium]